MDCPSKSKSIISSIVLSVLVSILVLVAAIQTRDLKVQLFYDCQNCSGNSAIVQE